VTVVDSFDDFYDPTRKRKNVEPHRADPRYRLVESDIRDPEALKPLEQERFDAVIHLAARAGVRPSIENARLYQQVNVGGTLNVLELARVAGVKKFVFGSSSSVYGLSPRFLSRKVLPLCPISPVRRDKGCRRTAYLYLHQPLWVPGDLSAVFYGVRCTTAARPGDPQVLLSGSGRGLPIPVFGGRLDAA
jgi:nucleoside-diphosphate-sugar epimerase